MKIISILVICSMYVFSQSNDHDIKNRLQHFKNYRFGNILLYEMSDLGDDFKKIVDENNKSKEELNEEDNSSFVNISDQVKEFVKLNASRYKVARDMLSQLTRNRINDIPDLKTLQALIDSYSRKKEVDKEQRLYVVLRNSDDLDIENKIIAVIYRSENPNFFIDEDNQRIENLLSNLDKKSNIYLKSDLENLEIAEVAKYNAKNALDFIKNGIIQEYYVNKTLDAKAIGQDYVYFKPIVGNSSPLIDYSLFGVSGKDIQKFKRISHGEPQKYIGVNQELLLSPDIVRWTMYPEPKFKEIEIYKLDVDGIEMMDDDGNLIIERTERVVDSNFITNDLLPLIGFELKYGADDINMPSFVSDRMNFSVLWSKVKLGVILPTSGWAVLQEDLFSIDRKLTHGGFGIAGEFDFDLPIIPKSDVFRLSFGYTFGDAVAAPYGSESIGNNLKKDPLLNQNLVNDPRNVDYLLRYNTTLLYTFGLDIDKDYLLRFGIGGSIYTMEEWKHDIIRNDAQEIIDSKFINNSTEAVGGISGKVDFMVKNNSTPYGASMNYFDETINLNLFVQFPVVENMLYLKLRANGNVLLRENQRPWEIGSFFMPMANIIYVF